MEKNVGKRPNTEPRRSEFDRDARRRARKAAFVPMAQARTDDRCPLPGSSLGKAAAGLLMAVALLAFDAHATNLYWDSNGTATGAGATPTGTWGVGQSAFWNTSSTGLGGTFTDTTTSSDDLFFSAGTDATGAFTVTIVKAGSVSANSITVEKGTVTLSQNTGPGSTLNIASGVITTNTTP